MSTTENNAVVLPGSDDVAHRWRCFIEYCRRLSERPVYKKEERFARIEAAHEVTKALELANAEQPWVPTLMNAMFQVNPGFKWDIAVRPPLGWLRSVMAASSEEFFRGAVARFLDRDDPPIERFKRFAQAIRQAARVAGAESSLEGTLAFGSLFNFAVDPVRCPIVNGDLFDGLQATLGYPCVHGGGFEGHYSRHLSFFDDVGGHLREAGVKSQDMMDLQNLIFQAAQDKDFWAMDRMPPPKSAARPKKHKRDDSKPDYLSVCAIYRDEAVYLAEWIEFHLSVGVERFYLYDNMSEDDHLEVLAPYIADGIVHLKHWQIYPGQNAAYDDCLTWHREHSRWIAFIDLDEFLFSPTGASLPEVLADYEPWPAVAVNWAVFGMNGHRTRPEGLVIETHTQRLDEDFNKHVKSIVDPTRTLRAVGPHWFYYAHLGAVDENFFPVRGANTKAVSSERLRINHYYAKSQEEWIAKAQRARAASGIARQVPTDEQMENAHREQARKGTFDDMLARRGDDIRARWAARQNGASLNGSRAPGLAQRSQR